MPVCPLKDFITDDISFLTSTSIHSYNLNPIIIYSKPKNVLLYNTIVALYENRKKKYSYWGYSICKPMMTELNKLYKKEHNEDIFTLKEGKFLLFGEKYKLLRELNYNTTTYNGKILFHNHASSYKNNKF